MLNEKENKRISKFLSLVLRHQPELIGLTLDENGWADVSELLSTSYKAQVTLDLPTLRHIVAINAKQRFAFNDTQTKIRANQGHSIGIDLGLEAAVPPDVLYHGTAERFFPLIKAAGLLKMQRQHVHLSADKHTAIMVGKRHGKPVVFTVAAGQMCRDGFTFYCADNGVWLTDHVPVKYLGVE